MTILGAGVMPAGLGPAGLWHDDTESTGRPAPSTLSLYHDPVERGPIYDETTGHLKQMSGVRQRVALTLATMLGSATTLAGWGMRKLDRHGTNFLADREHAVRDALRTMTDAERLIRIESISTEVDGARDRTTVVYTDLTSGITGNEVTV